MRGFHPPATRYRAEYVGKVRPVAGRIADDVRWHTEARERVDACEAGMQEGRFAIACRGEDPKRPFARVAKHSRRCPRGQVPGSRRPPPCRIHPQVATRPEAAPIEWTS